MRQAWVEVTCVGVRQLKTYRLRTPSEPYVRVDVPAPDDGGNNFSTRPSSRPSGRIFCCCLCCVLVALLWFYLGMYYVNIYNMLEAFGIVGDSAI